MRYLILPALLALAYVAVDDGASPVPAAKPPAADPTALAAAAPDAAKESRRGAPDADLGKRPKPEPVLIDDTRPAPHPVLRAQGIGPGRYWLETLPNNYFILLDTHTGHCWMRSLSDTKWHDLGSPAEQ
jgi:hypothetical protein